MGLSVWNTIAILTILLGMSNTVSGLMCYQCNSSLDYNCQEMFDHDSGNNPLVSTNCDLYEARYCIKAIGIWGGIAGTHRFCSAKDLGDQCQYIVYPDHDRVYQACVFTCTSDQCNHALSLSDKLTIPLLLMTALFIFILR